MLHVDLLEVKMDDESASKEVTGKDGSKPVQLEALMFEQLEVALNKSASQTQL